ncbi:winged helix-turn-helix transcriptional regulator [Roseateles sp. DAIF2]|uniref:ArsR/SmtB family transcription factor n=1 Tax=Roseateles sp. DAIF2 TaxID=2714952 RepID=UPI0018A24F14|nr:metalloregulator ArsR/SmtB family transcription factor [Roseateles sp. DAIF2]QPF74703.1 winged helix-turn-helix transcriptional regulator [Roseateles sp. DAIF2]
MPSPHAIAPPEARLDRLFVALADGNRRGMVDRLSAGPASVSELAKPLGIALPSALKHLALLEAGGIVCSEKSGRVRTYRIAPEAFGALEDWVAQRKTQWQRQFDRLEAYLRDTQEEDQE